MLYTHSFHNQHSCMYYFFNTRVWLSYNVVLVSAVQQSESVIHTSTVFGFKIPFPIRSLQSTD